MAKKKSALSEAVSLLFKQGLLVFLFFNTEKKGTVSKKTISKRGRCLLIVVFAIVQQVSDGIRRFDPLPENSPTTGQLDDIEFADESGLFSQVEKKQKSSLESMVATWIMYTLAISRTITDCCFKPTCLAKMDSQI